MTQILLFPGQGAQKVGMAKDLFDTYPSVRELFKTASEQSGFDTEHLLFAGSDDELKETEKTQVAVTLANLASYEALKNEGLRDEATLAVAGFSLGEYAALAAGGVCSYKDVFYLVRERGRLMAQAGSAITTAKGAVGMAAVMGLDAEKVKEIVNVSGRNDVFCANYNSPSQIILSGLENGIEAIEKPLKEAGAKRVIKLKVSGPFHTPLLSEAAAAFSEVLNKVTFNNPKTALFSNVNGQKITKGSEIKKLLEKQISNPVLWMDIEHNIRQLMQADTVVAECGPGIVLGGLWRAMFNENIRAVSTVDQVKSFMEQ
jgi:[acyl-carrier-protein] S-malonyltransferase